MSYPVVPNTFVNSTTADATLVNANFTAIINGITDGTKDINASKITANGTLIAAATLSASTAQIGTVVASGLSANTGYFANGIISSGVISNLSASTAYLSNFTMSSGFVSAMSVTSLYVQNVTLAGGIINTASGIAVVSGVVTPLATTWDARSIGNICDFKVNNLGYLQGTVSGLAGFYINCSSVPAFANAGNNTVERPISVYKGSQDLLGVAILNVPGGSSMTINIMNHSGTSFVTFASGDSITLYGPLVMSY